MSLTLADRRKGAAANPLTDEERRRGQALGRATMVRSGHLARMRRAKRARRDLVEIVLDLFPEVFR